MSYAGSSAFLFPHPKEQTHKQLAMQLIEDGRTMGDFTRAVAYLALTDPKFRTKVYSAIHKVRKLEPIGKEAKKD